MAVGAHASALGFKGSHCLRYLRGISRAIVEAYHQDVEDQPQSQSGLPLRETAMTCMHDLRDISPRYPRLAFHPHPYRCNPLLSGGR